MTSSPDPSDVVVSTPTPDTTTVVLTIIRLILMIAGAAGLTSAHFTDAELVPIAGAISTLIGVGWTIYEQWHQAQLKHQSAVVSATRGRALQVKRSVSWVK